MGGRRPGLGHNTVLWLEPKRAAATVGAVVGLLVFGAIAIAAVSYPGSDLATRWPPNQSIPARWVHVAAAVTGTFALICFAAAVVNARRWRTARAVEKLSNDPRLAPLLPSTEWTAPSLPADRIPPLEVVPLDVRRLPKPRPLARVTAGRNVVGAPPLAILYLRLFENLPRARTFMEGAWREFGHVAMLRSATSVTPRELRDLERGGAGKLFVTSSQQLDHELARSARRPLGKGRHVLRDVGPSTVRVRDRYGAYPVIGLLCHGRFWKVAVDRLLDQADLVVVDLSGYRSKNQGTRHEIEAVINRVPIEHVVFLADPKSNVRFLAEQVQDAWTVMAAGSPNARPGRHRATIAVTDVIVRSSTTDAHGNRQEHVRLVAKRRQTRRVAAYAQARATAGRSRAA
jgi:hypothetical protein